MRSRHGMRKILMNSTPKHALCLVVATALTAIFSGACRQASSTRGVPPVATSSEIRGASKAPGVDPFVDGVSCKERDDDEDREATGAAQAAAQRYQMRIGPDGTIPPNALM